MYSFVLFFIFTRLSECGLCSACDVPKLWGGKATCVLKLFALFWRAARRAGPIMRDESRVAAMQAGCLLTEVIV